MKAFAVPATVVLDAVVTDSAGMIDPNRRRAAAWEWQCRHEFELEARSRFRRLADSLSHHHASDAIVQLTEKAAADAPTEEAKAEEASPEEAPAEEEKADS